MFNADTVPPFDANLLCPQSPNPLAVIPDGPVTGKPALPSPGKACLARPGFGIGIGRADSLLACYIGGKVGEEDIRISLEEQGFEQRFEEIHLFTSEMAALDQSASALQFGLASVLSPRDCTPSAAIPRSGRPYARRQWLSDQELRLSHFLGLILCTNDPLWPLEGGPANRRNSWRSRHSCVPEVLSCLGRNCQRLSRANATVPEGRHPFCPGRPA